MKRPAIPYSDTELAWAKAHKTRPRRQAHTAFCQKFNRPDVTLANYIAMCKRNGWMTGRTGCYTPGRTPENKGKKMPFNPNSARTQFKKGHAPHNTKHLGHERITKDGYVEISVAKTNPHIGYERRYVQKHRYLWEKANGHVPEGMVLKSLDGDKTNTAPANWEAIPRALLPRLNGRWSLGYDEAEPEVKPAIMAAAKLEHKVRALKGGE